LVTINISGKTEIVKIDTSLAELLPTHIDSLPVVAALVDKKATSLMSLITSGCRIEPITTSAWEGQRIWRQSLALVALEAAYAIAPRSGIKMGPSVGFGQRLLVPYLHGEELAEFGRRLETKMQELIQQALRLREEHWAVDETREHFRAGGWHDAEELLLTWRYAEVPLVSYGAVRAINLGPLVPNTSGLGAFYVLCDEDFLLVVYGRRSHHPPRPTRTMPAMALTDVGEAPPPESQGGSTRSLLLTQARSSAESQGQVPFEEQAWLRTLGVTSIGTFNRICVESSVPELIRVSEGFQEKRITGIADTIQARGRDVDIVCIAGPSSSGKTTFIRRLCVQLKVNGITPVGLGLDDYYVDRDKSPRDAAGDYDFEALEALQLELLHEHIRRLLRGETVATAHYDFKEGKSRPDGGRQLRLEPRNVLLVEGIHGLNPDLLGSVPLERVFRVFVCPMMQLSFDHLSRIHASDVRLIRRIVRDRHARGHKAADTIERWPKVRAGERRHIYPHQPNADAVFDSSLVYELSTLRVYAERYLLEVPRDHSAFTTAFRLIHLLDRFVSIYPDHVPPNSILREFIGGSGFEY
jgi:uridine kinase